MSAPAAELAVDGSVEAAHAPTYASASLRTSRVNIMRIGYAVMGVGLAFVK